MTDNTNNIFLIGAPKSGTSSLFDWLKVHPAIQASNPKETFFFMDEDHPLRGRHGLSVQSDGPEAFERFFTGSEKNKFRIEGSVHSFYQKTARDYFSVMDPMPHIVMVLREPGRRMLSAFRFTRDNLANIDGSLTFDDYVKYLLSQTTSTLDKHYHNDSSLWIAKRGLELSHYIKWIDWWREVIPESHFHLIVAEQMYAEPKCVISCLCRKFGVDPRFYDEYDFNEKNPTYTVGKKRLHRLARCIAPFVPRNNSREWLKALYLRWQKRSAPQDAHFESGLGELRNHFVTQNRELVDRYGLNLERWWGADAITARERQSV